MYSEAPLRSCESTQVCVVARAGAFAGTGEGQAVASVNEPASAYLASRTSSTSSGRT